MALRAAILRHLRVPVRNLTVNQSRIGFLESIRSFTSRNDHLTKQDVVDRVLGVVKRFPKVDPAKVTPEAHLEKDLGLDSLDSVEILMAIDEEFNIEINDREANKLDSCSLYIDYVYSNPKSHASFMFVE